VYLGDEEQLEGGAGESRREVGQPSETLDERVPTSSSATKR
jgi:hypothetical protein